MAITIPGYNSANAILLPQKAAPQGRAAALPESVQAKLDSRMSLNAANNPTELILQAAQEKINEMFKPYLGDGAVQRAVDSGVDMSPEATAERIISFATQLIGRAENAQIDLPADEQRSREQLFNNVQVGIERGFEQARDILEGLQALNGGVKDTVDTTYSRVQEGLSNLALLLGLSPPEQIQA
ncbi:hypothetical protein F3F96_05695 [Mariprofundus sp. NF]|uniref:DUF5610 domain-containing protein n=1 Tax=Mariprofundus sp. NF TaxID=2608716 RepID=UPI0015A271AF|nr:DUF5610 domain-containing protein [Mariprofundus sp. NF]NWF38621.1 hypothetical protein [Mariprofundus sp. NF]